MAEQIDKLSKKMCKLAQGEKAYVKHLHKRQLRRQAKMDHELAPRHNRYSGWIA